MYKVTKNEVTTENAKNYVAFLQRNDHTVDLINYLHDLNEQLKSGKHLQHDVVETDENYYAYFKTNIDKVRCNRNCQFKTTEFQYYNFGLMFEQDSMNKSNNQEYYLLEDGNIIVEQDTNTVLLSYHIGDDILLIKEHDHQLQFFTQSKDEYIQYLKDEKLRTEVDNYMIDHLEPAEDF